MNELRTAEYWDHVFEQLLTPRPSKDTRSVSRTPSVPDADLGIVDSQHDYFDRDAQATGV